MTAIAKLCVAVLLVAVYCSSAAAQTVTLGPDWGAGWANVSVSLTGGIGTTNLPGGRRLVASITPAKDAVSVKPEYLMAPLSGPGPSQFWTGLSWSGRIVGGNAIVSRPVAVFGGNTIRKYQTVTVSGL